MLEFYNEQLRNFAATDKLNENYPLSRHPRVLTSVARACVQRKRFGRRVYCHL